MNADRLSKRDIVDHLHTCLREWRDEQKRATQNAEFANAEARIPGKSHRGIDHVVYTGRAIAIMGCIQDVERFLKGTDCEHDDE